MAVNDQKKSFVVIGGGTGTHTVLSGLKKYADQIDLTAIVTMADSGGSTGRLRDEFGYLPVGDVRMALAALAREDEEDEQLLRKLFLYRFEKGEGLSGHSVGNLLLVALTHILGSEEEAIRAASRVLQVHGEVIPVTTGKIQLRATYEDGSVMVGEHEIDEPTIDRHHKRITHLETIPTSTINSRAADAILGADMIVLGPGDLYTSILANVVVDGVADALKQTNAQLVYVCNLMTKVGQTSGMNAHDHIHEIERYIGRQLSHALVHVGNVPEALRVRYEGENEYPVVLEMNGDLQKIITGDFAVLDAAVKAPGDLLKRSLIRHDPAVLATTLFELAGISRLH